MVYCLSSILSPSEWTMVRTQDTWYMHRIDVVITKGFNDYLTSLPLII